METEIEEVRNIGMSGNALNDVLLERQYMSEHPCSCGGNWTRESGGSAYPKFVYSHCRCEKCQSEKQFIFYF